MNETGNPERMRSNQTREESISVGVEAVEQLDQTVLPDQRCDTSRTADAAGETALVGAARQGSLRAFEELYRQTGGAVFALCLRMTNDPALAEDLVQETFVRGWQRLRTFRGESSFSTWIYRVAVNVVLGHKRSRTQERTIGEGREEHAWTDGAPIDLRLDLERAISRLPERARLVLILHDIRGYRHREIAGILGIAEGTSKAQLHRARQLVREALSP